MEDGIFPHFSSFVEQSELEEERRACYVAITRAKKKLYITAAESRMFFGKKRPQEISRFVEEIPDACVESLGNKAKPHQKNSSGKSYKATTPQPAQIKPVEKKIVPPADLQVGDMINHRKWGLGTIMTVNGDKIVVQFTNPEYGVKTLGLKAAPINKV